MVLHVPKADPKADPYLNGVETERTLPCDNADPRVQLERSETGSALCDCASIKGWAENGQTELCHHYHGFSHVTHDPRNAFRGTPS